MLNDRKEKILKLIVEEQIKTCRPVGSSSLCDKLKVVQIYGIDTKEYIDRILW